MGYFLKGKAYKRANDGGTANAKGSKQNKAHNPLLSSVITQRKAFTPECR